MYDTALTILKKIEKYNFKAYIVGGFVRDYILNIDSIDIDICTNATPKDLSNIFTNIKIPRISKLVRDNETIKAIKLIRNALRLIMLFNEFLFLLVNINK